MKIFLNDAKNEKKNEALYMAWFNVNYLSKRFKTQINS